ncbi:MAG: MmgE/PrpD family protein [Hyphomicrobiales bacterium]|nr:MmgE/PrpD family protein [Hyphomicrobiales bacterium]
MSNPPVTRLLAQFAACLRYQDIPDHVRALLPVLLIDWFRAGCVGAGRDWTQRAAQVTLGLSNDPVCSILFSTQRADAVRAAYQNGVIAGSLDWDDSHIAALVHPGVVIWPALFAAAEITRPSGARFLEAAVAGYETAIRLGMGLQPDHALRGFQATPSCGVFGATVAAGLILGLDEEGLVNALGLAASYASGSSQFFLSGSDVKRLHAGKAAAAGVEIALLARAGLTGPRDGIEGEQGFGRAVSDTFRAQTMVEALGERFWIDEIALKVHAGTVRLQAAIEAAQALSREGIVPASIASVEIGVPRVLLGKITSNAPVDMQQAQMSGPFAVAMTFQLMQRVSGPLVLGLDEFESLVGDPDVRDLSLRTTCVFDAEMDAGMIDGKVPARVTVRTHAGTTHTQRVFFPKGCRENPMTREEVLDRARLVLSATHAPDRIEAWIRAVDRLHTQASIDGIML